MEEDEWHNTLYEKKTYQVSVNSPFLPSESSLGGSIAVSPLLPFFSFHPSFPHLPSNFLPLPSSPAFPIPVFPILIPCFCQEDLDLD